MRFVASALVLAVLFCLAPPAGAAEAEKASHVKTCGGQTYVTGPDGRVFCEMHWDMANENCTGAEQLPLLAEPWEPSAISIRGVTIALEAVGVTVGHVFAGNSFNHDVMAWLDPAREGVVRQWFPDGLSFQFPGVADEAPKSRSHVDLHVTCLPKGASYNAHLILYYTIP